MGDYLEDFDLSASSRIYTEQKQGWYHELPFANEILDMYSNETMEAFYDRGDIYITDEQRAQVEAAVSRLTPNQRKIYDLYFKQNMTQEEIAAMLDKHQTTIQACIHGSKDRTKRLQGGIIKKLKRIIENETGKVRYKPRVHSLTETEMRVIAEADSKAVDLAAKYKVSVHVIYNIRRKYGCSSNSP